MTSADFSLIIADLDAVLELFTLSNTSLSNRVTEFRDALTKQSLSLLYDQIESFERPSQFFNLTSEVNHFDQLTQRMAAERQIGVNTVGTFRVFTGQLRDLQRSIASDQPAQPLSAISQSLGVIVGFVHSNLVDDIRTRLFPEIDHHLNLLGDFVTDWLGYMALLRICARVQALLAEIEWAD
jgi:hypothetical protein